MTQHDLLAAARAACSEAYPPLTSDLRLPLYNAVARYSQPLDAPDGPGLYHWIRPGLPDDCVYIDDHGNIEGYSSERIEDYPGSKLYRVVPSPTAKE